MSDICELLWFDIVCRGLSGNLASEANYRRVFKKEKDYASKGAVSFS